MYTFTTDAIKFAIGALCVLSDSEQEAVISAAVSAARKKAITAHGLWCAVVALRLEGKLPPKYAAA